MFYRTQHLKMKLKNFLMCPTQQAVIIKTVEVVPVLHVCKHVKVLHAVQLDGFLLPVIKLSVPG